jgi:hypothetical protein
MRLQIIFMDLAEIVKAITIVILNFRIGHGTWKGVLGKEFLGKERHDGQRRGKEDVGKHEDDPGIWTSLQFFTS